MIICHHHHNHNHHHHHHPAEVCALPLVSGEVGAVCDDLHDEDGGDDGLRVNDLNSSMDDDDKNVSG